MILLVLFTVCASSKADVEILVDGIWVVPSATKTAAEVDTPVLLSLVNAPSSRCPQDETFSEDCDKCYKCPDCSAFNHRTCQCHRKPFGFGCKAASPNNPTSKTSVPGDDIFNGASKTKALTISDPTTTYTVQDMPTTMTSSSIKTPTIFVPTTIVTTSEIYSTVTITSTKTSTTLVTTPVVTTSEIPNTATTAKAPIASTTLVATPKMSTTTTATATKEPTTLVPTLKVNNQEMPIKTNTTSKGHTTPDITTQTPTTRSHITLVPTTTDIISEISIVEDPMTHAVTPIAPSTISSESSNADPWLYGGRCGTHHLLPDGRPGQCNPQGEYPCCNHDSGWCGSTPKHCDCKGCVDYRDSWLQGGRCGPQHLLPSGRSGQCDPQGEHPCCNSNSGWCGNTKRHCTCQGCIDYRESENITSEAVPAQDLGTPNLNAFESDLWLPGGRCGPQHLLSDGRVAQCNPEGKYPCCNQNSGWCGNTKIHCSCKNCIDYRDMN